MNSHNLILRQTDFPPLVNKNDFIDSSEFDANFTNIYEDLVALCVTSGVLNFDADETYDDSVNQFAMHDGRLYRFIFATPTSNVTPGTESSEAYWLEIFPTDLAHRKNSDTILAEGTASQVTASEIRAFIDAGLTSTTNLSITEHTSTSLKLNSSTGADVVIPQATPTEAGLLNSEDKVKLQQLSGENSGDQTLGSLGAEAVSNKVDDLDTPNATTYPTTNAVSTALSSAKSDIIGAAPSNLNTLEELSNAIGNDPDFSDSVSTALGGKEASLPSMVGNALKVLRVNAGATAKEWHELPAEGITIGTTPVVGGTDGRVLFQSGGVVQQDSTLFWDNTNKRLGVGISLPQARLDVRAQGALSTDIAFRVRNSADSANLVALDGTGVLTMDKVHIIGGGTSVYVGPATNKSVGSSNTHLGYYAGYNGYGPIPSGDQNTFIGAYSGFSTTGRANVALGSFAGSDATSGMFNTFLGNNTGRGIINGSYNTIVGSQITGLSNVSNNVILADGQGNKVIHFDSVNALISNIKIDTTTGVKIGTSTTQKLSFWNATPIVQPTTSVTASTFVTNTSLIANDTATFDGYTIGQVVKALRNLGILA